MGIRVECPHGHVFKVKDKYAGKKGLCPHCHDQVVIRVPDMLHSAETLEAHKRAVAEEKRAQQSAASAGASSVLDDTTHHEDASSSGSLLSSSVIRHNVKCTCGQPVPMWYAKCPNCGKFLKT